MPPPAAAPAAAAGANGDASGEWSASSGSSRTADANRRRDDAHHDPAGRVGVVSRGARRKYGDSVVRRQRCAGTAQAVAAAAAAAEAVAMRVRVVCVPMVCIYACAETTDGERLHV